MVEILVAVLIGSGFLLALIYVWGIENSLVKRDAERRDERLHHCVRCAHIYLANTDISKDSSCPACGQVNPPLQF